MSAASEPTTISAGLTRCCTGGRPPRLAGVAPPAGVNPPAGPLNEGIGVGWYEPSYGWDAGIVMAPRLLTGRLWQIRANPGKSAAGDPGHAQSWPSSPFAASASSPAS